MNTPNGSGGSMGAGTTGNLDARLDNIKQKAKDLVDQGQEKVGQMKTRVMGAKDQAVTRGNAYLDRATEMIRANPIKAVGIAFAAGYVGMRLFRR